MKFLSEFRKHCKQFLNFMSLKEKNWNVVQLFFFKYRCSYMFIVNNWVYDFKLILHSLLIGLVSVVSVHRSHHHRYILFEELISWYKNHVKNFNTRIKCYVTYYGIIEKYSNVGHDYLLSRKEFPFIIEQ